MVSGTVYCYPNEYVCHVRQLPFFMMKNACFCVNSFARFTDKDCFVEAIVGPREAMYSFHYSVVSQK